MAEPSATTAPTLRRALVTALVVPAVLVVAAVAVLADFVARRALEGAMGERLVSVAQAAATQLSPRLLLLERGDDDTRLKRNALSKLDALKTATEVERILVVKTTGNQTLIDTAGELSVADEYPRARFDAHELTQVQAGQGIASLLFTGPQGAPYKTGYAPFLDDDGKVTGYVGVKAPANYAAAIDRLRGSMAVVAVVGLIFLLLAAAWSAQRIAVPLSALSQAAESVGTGRWDTDIPVGGPREARVLAMTMRHMTASLRARDDEMQMMLASIAHEVRNPLGGIELFGGMLKEDLEDDPRQKHVLKILRELGTLAKVVNDFLDFARRRPPEIRTVRLFDLTFEVASLMEKDLTDKSVDLKLEVPKDLDADVDPEHIKRAILNVVKNAVQAVSSEEGWVRLTASEEQGHACIVIEDNGPGIDDDKKKDIFTPFFTTKQKGTGLGLALVKKAVDEHHGTISVQTSDDGGAKFILRLPIRGSAPPQGG